MFIETPLHEEEYYRVKRIKYFTESKHWVHFEAAPTHIPEQLPVTMMTINQDISVHKDNLLIIHVCFVLLFKQLHLDSI